MANPSPFPLTVAPFPPATRRPTRRPLPPPLHKALSDDQFAAQFAAPSPETPTVPIQAPASTKSSKTQPAPVAPIDDEEEKDQEEKDQEEKDEEATDDDADAADVCRRGRPSNTDRETPAFGRNTGTKTRRKTRRPFPQQDPLEWTGVAEHSILAPVDAEGVVRFPIGWKDKPNAKKRTQKIVQLVLGPPVNQALMLQFKVQSHIRGRLKPKDLWSKRRGLVEIPFGNGYMIGLRQVAHEIPGHALQNRYTMALNLDRCRTVGEADVILIKGARYEVTVRPRDENDPEPPPDEGVEGGNPVVGAPLDEGLRYFIWGNNWVYSQMQPLPGVQPLMKTVPLQTTGIPRWYRGIRPAIEEVVAERKGAAGQMEYQVKLAGAERKEWISAQRLKTLEEGEIRVDARTGLKESIASREARRQAKQEQADREAQAARDEQAEVDAREREAEEARVRRVRQQRRAQTAAERKAAKRLADARAYGLAVMRGDVPPLPLPVRAARAAPVGLAPAAVLAPPPPRTSPRPATAEPILLTDSDSVGILNTQGDSKNLPEFLRLIENSQRPSQASSLSGSRASLRNRRARGGRRPARGSQRNQLRARKAAKHSNDREPPQPPGNANLPPMLPFIPAPQERRQDLATASPLTAPPQQPEVQFVASPSNPQAQALAADLNDLGPPTTSLLDPSGGVDLLPLPVSGMSFVEPLDFEAGPLDFP